jgi:Fe-S cluster assembly scaffold protein SufB
MIHDSYILTTPSKRYYLADEEIQQDISVNHAGEYYLGFVLQWAKAHITININSPDIKVHTIFLLASAEKQISHLTTDINIQASNASAHMDIRSFALANWLVEIDSGMYIAPWLTDVQAHLQQENILLSDQARIHTTPRLDVQSNQVQASHGAKIEKLDPIKMFYIQSRGVSSSQAWTLIVDSYIHQFIKHFALTPEQQAQLSKNILWWLSLHPYASKTL